jgi:hypothetical protein
LIRIHRAQARPDIVENMAVPPFGLHRANNEHYQR